MSRVTTGTFLGTSYYGDEVQELIRAALDENVTPREERLAQGVLDALYTVMFWGKFEDFSLKASSVADFPLWGTS